MVNATYFEEAHMPSSYEPTMAHSQRIASVTSQQPAHSQQPEDEHQLRHWTCVYVCFQRSLVGKDKTCNRTQQQQGQEQDQEHEPEQQQQQEQEQEHEPHQQQHEHQQQQHQYVAGAGAGAGPGPGA